MNKLALLQRHFGHGGFREGQEALVDALLSGRDVLGVMPTGAGKSICFQLPALILPGMALVISPLISLMKDQVMALKQNGVPAAYLNSSLSPGQQQEALRRAGRGAYKLMYVAPERLNSPDFLDFVKGADISLVAVDEAHCVSQWGQDFRPSYLEIAVFISKLGRRVPVGAFTATATARVKADIESLLGLHRPLTLTTGFDRPNLYFQVARPRNKLAFLLDFITEKPGECGIVYCSTRKETEKVSDALNRAGIEAVCYHAGLMDAVRMKNQDDFVNDKKTVMVATNAFGMGIDKSNVGFVVHYNLPKDVESYYQEAGRAGRDGEPARCVLLYDPRDEHTCRYLITHSAENEALTPEEREELRRRDLYRLQQMVRYCQGSSCLRAYLLGYFGQQTPAACGACGNCQGRFETADITAMARSILDAVESLLQRNIGLNTTMMVRLLTGSRDKRLVALSLDRHPAHGILQGMNRIQLREMLDYLVAEGWLKVNEERYQRLEPGPKARLLQEAEPRLMYARRQPEPSEQRAKGSKARSQQAEPVPATADADLFETLRALRLRLAQEEEVPAFVVFSNASLRDMCAKRPASLEAFLQVSGVGVVKAERYGAAFVEAIRAWLAAQDEAVLSE